MGRRNRAWLRTGGAAIVQKKDLEGDKKSPVTLLDSRPLRFDG